MNVNIKIDTRTVIRILAVVTIFALSVSFISATKSALTLILIAAFLAMALNPPVAYISSKITGGSRGAATAIAYLTVLGIIGGFLWAIVPPLVEQTREFVTHVPEYVEDLANGDGAISSFVRDNDLDVEVQNFFESYTSGTALGETSSRLFEGLGAVGAGLVAGLTVLVLTFFMLVEGPGWLEKLWLAQPEEDREHRRSLGKRMYNVITGYVNGQLLIALLAATSSLIAILLIGLPLPLPLAGLVGLFGLIPLVGATLGSVVVILVALSQSFVAGLVMLAFFLIYQQIENNFIQPYIQSRALEISPLLIFVAVLFGISIGGLLGAFLAIPAAACIRILFTDYVEQKTVKETPTTTVGKIKKMAKSKTKSA